MAPELLNTEEARELRGLAEKVRDYQESKKLSDSALLRKFAGLGSTKTFTRILANDLGELDLERQLNNYRAVWALIESIGDDHAADEELYDDLRPYLDLKRAVFETMRETGPNRLIILEGDTGQGKSTCRRLLINKYGQRLLWIEANVAWGDRDMAMTGAILRALGLKELPSGRVDRLDKVVERLSETRRCLIVDEAHHMGVQTLNCLKTLINQTPGEFVLLAYPSLWARLETNAYHEARQLIGNRLAERIRLGSPSESDLRKFVTRRCPGAADALNGKLTGVLGRLADKARNRGNLAFVRDVCTRVNTMCEGTTGPSEDTFTAAMEAEVASR
jgi:hypothetical protein